jgi:predicted RNA polymerase sigma factor
LDEYHLLHAVLGELETRRGQTKAAIKHFEAALALTSTKSEQAHLRRRIDACRAK